MKPSNITIKYHLGIDISKLEFHVALLRFSDGEIVTANSFENNAKGHHKLIKWLTKHTDANLPVHASMEATGCYGDHLAVHLHKQLTKVSVINPRSIKHFASMQMRRNKSDKADARIIAQYSASQQPPAWDAPSQEQVRIKATARRIGQLQDQHDMERNHLEAALEKHTQQDIKSHMTWLKKRIEKLQTELYSLIEANPSLAQMLRLITSIKGIGIKSGCQIIAELPDLKTFTNARSLGAYAGVTPRHRQSGTSGKIRTPMSKAGSSQSRSAPFVFW